jgi:hypothetical protein
MNFGTADNSVALESRFLNLFARKAVNSFYIPRRLRRA